MGLWLNHESDIDRQINRQLTYVNQSHSLASIFILHTKLIINQSVNIFKPRIYSCTASKHPEIWCASSQSIDLAPVL